ncbi:RNAse E [Rhodothalassium salexigens DSM 2132]|uniref:Ribonuclease E n=1 Tax=Rhodothalassium salexigens DSM 2132 TaxID=1188247 RepID=A0A4R2PUM5_RHOSA|nr:ribonuclease E/G [Rhodothalassium salexigens]MBB4210572.1 ribonuclease E [Rhodothalassium salexigens DSM 2132]TCP37871.1 RNAse E [Rhodothalassium salexigens DSM 2132]
MSTRMLIDARHEEETRVTVIKGNRIEEFDYESSTKRQLKGNIYLAKVTRVEPSLQAAFVEYGGNRQGFLAFSEIHPDYYQIPVADREALLREEQDAAAADAAREPDGNGDGEVETLGDDAEDPPRPTASAHKKRYKIQEVIKRRQILLIQVVKEERGSKGAALTTYLSLAGRYCVLMPNSTTGGGISRKIANAGDRKRLKSVMEALAVPEGMGCIIRTAGLSRTKAEIKRDFDYLIRLWDEIRTLTLKSVAPCLVYEEANLIKRSIRDLYTRDIDEVLVEGETGYRTAKDFMRMLMPSHARKVKHYKDNIPLFHRYQVEQQLESMYNPEVELRSGGYIVINPTEALVSIDVNSGRSTKEHNIEETALKTNLEAADEVARQLRLRDMAGLVVIDFIDMDERGNNRAVEKRLKDALKTDRARVQVGRISPFGLLEMSRQRLRPNLIEASTVTCAACKGTGTTRSVESQSLRILRRLEEEGIRDRSGEVIIHAPAEVVTYLFNRKRTALADLEARYGLSVSVYPQAGDDGEAFLMERLPKDAEPGADPIVVRQETGAGERAAPPPEAPARAKSRERDAETSRERDKPRETPTPQAEAAGGNDGGSKKKRRRRPRRKKKTESETIEAQAGTETAETVAETAETAAAPVPATADGADGDDTAKTGASGDKPSRSRRSRRRKPKASAETRAEDGQTADDGATPAAESPADATAATADEAADGGRETQTDAAPGSDQAAADDAQKPAKSSRSRRSRRRKPSGGDDAPAAQSDGDATAPPAGDGDAPALDATPPARPKRRVRRKPAEADTPAGESAANEGTEPAPAAPLAPTAEPAPTADARKPADPQAAKPKTAQPETGAGAASPDTPADTPAKPKSDPVAAAPRPDAPVMAEDTGGVERQRLGQATGDDATAEESAASDADRPKRKGWWQRAFGN